MKTCGRNRNQVAMRNTTKDTKGSNKTVIVGGGLIQETQQPPTRNAREIAPPIFLLSLKCLPTTRSMMRAPGAKRLQCTTPTAGCSAQSAPSETQDKVQFSSNFVYNAPDKHRKAAMGAKTSRECFDQAAATNTRMSSDSIPDCYQEVRASFCVSCDFHIFGLIL